MLPSEENPSPGQAAAFHFSRSEGMSRDMSGALVFSG
jgi:hypothetical protein